MTHLIHRYRNWEKFAEYDQKIDGHLAYSVTIFVGRCEVCGKPKRKKVKH